MPKPKLSVNILTKNSARRLAGRLELVAGFADEILVGVDDASTDETLKIASELADVVYRFRHPGQLAQARMLVFDYASGDWILSLDDDEEIEESFDAILPELLTHNMATHVWFPRKWIVNADPCEYLHAPPWFPDWQLRMFRNERSLIWKPSYPHSGYRAMGPAHFECRAAILHFEPIWCSPEERRRKVDRYRNAGGGGIAEEFYAEDQHGVERRAARLRPAAGLRRKNKRAMAACGVHELSAEPDARWNCDILHADMPAHVHAGEELVAQVRVENTGSLSWTPFGGARCAQLQLSYHLLSLSGECILWDGARCAVPRLVRPGEQVVFLPTFFAPSEPGDYLLEWDMVSEHECWFSNCGAKTFRNALRVIDR